MKHISPTFKGKCQKRYRHKKDYAFFDEDGNHIMTFKIDVKLSEKELEKELRDYKEMSGGAKCFIVWTAQNGKCMKEVQI